jgi:hypothetical protein
MTVSVFEKEGRAIFTALSSLTIDYFTEVDNSCKNLCGGRRRANDKREGWLTGAAI